MSLFISRLLVGVAFTALGPVTLLRAQAGTEPGRIEGRLAGVGGTTIGRGTVQVRGRPGLVLTDGTGAFELLGLPRGRYLPQNGDALAIAALGRAGKFIGHALADFLVIFNPTMVIFGGSVSFSGNYLFDPMRKALKKTVMDLEYLDNLEITIAKLGEDAGLLRALALAKSKIKHDN